MTCLKVFSACSRSRQAVSWPRVNRHISLSFMNRKPASYIALVTAAGGFSANLMSASFTFRPYSTRKPSPSRVPAKVSVRWKL